METILEILVAAIFTNWKKVRVFSKKRVSEATVSKRQLTIIKMVRNSQAQLLFADSWALNSNSKRWILKRHRRKKMELSFVDS